MDFFINGRKRLDKMVSLQHHSVTIFTVALALTILVLACFTGYLWFNSDREEVNLEFVIATAIVTVCTSLMGIFEKLVKKVAVPDITRPPVGPKMDKAYIYKLCMILTPLVFCFIFMAAFRGLVAPPNATPKSACILNKSMPHDVYTEVKTRVLESLPYIVSQATTYDEQIILNEMIAYRDSITTQFVSALDLDSACMYTLTDSIHTHAVADKEIAGRIKLMIHITNDLNNNLGIYADSLNTQKIMDTYSIAPSVAIIVYDYGNLDHGDAIPGPDFLFKVQTLVNKTEVVNVHLNKTKTIDTLYLNAKHNGQ